MRAIVQLVFLLFYLGSSYVTTQHRISYFVHKLEHSKTKKDASLEHEGKQRVRYTHFREAKKVALDFHFKPDPAPELVPPVFIQTFHTQVLSLQTQFDVETCHSRAPPTL
jgi:hypothetical protein